MKKSPTLAIGAMRNLIVIETPTETQANDGSYGASPWVTFGRAMASVKPVSATEYVMAQQIAAEQTHIVAMRYMRGITSDMRIKYSPDGTVRYLYIVTPPRDLDERHLFIEMRCREREA
jgi:SPP1 family predicted phage head-tail adaptor